MIDYGVSAEFQFLKISTRGLLNQCPHSGRGHRGTKNDFMSRGNLPKLLKSINIRCWKAWSFLTTREAAWLYNFGRVCLSVSVYMYASLCLSDDNFRKPW